MKMNPLAKLMRDNAQRPRNLRIESTEDTTTVYVYDVIGMDFMGDGVSAKRFAEELAAIKSPNIALRINSPGGDVFEARAMVSALSKTTAKVTAYVDGVAASAASVLAMAADEVVMAPGSFLMIHNAWTMGIGDRNEFLELAALLEKVDGTIADDYAKKSGKTRDEVHALMDAETWFTAEEAVDAKLADRVDEKSPKVNAAWNLTAYAHAPTIPEPPKENEFEEACAVRNLRFRILEQSPA